jgi:hypothetical protein
MEVFGLYCSFDTGVYMNVAEYVGCQVRSSKATTQRD